MTRWISFGLCRQNKTHERLLPAGGGAPIAAAQALQLDQASANANENIP
jgi:hypothetical protein